MKKLSYLILPLFLFFGIQKVSASDVLSANVPSNWCGNGADTCTFTQGQTRTIGFGGAFNGYGNGSVVFTYFQYGRGSVYEATIENTNGALFQCNLLTTNSYIDNDKQYSIVTATCPVDFSLYGMKNLYLHNVAYTSEVIINDFQLSNRITFVQDSKYDIIKNIQALNIAELSTKLSNIYSRLDGGFHDIYELLKGNNDEILKKQQELLEQQQKNTDAVNNLNNSLNDSNISGANDSLNGFTNNELFNDTTGILAIIQAPINMLNSLTNTSCSPLSLPLPFLNVNLDIPCLSSIFAKHLSTELLTLLKLAINGFLVYKILCSFAMDIHNYKDPDSDRLEVIEL